MRMVHVHVYVQPQCYGKGSIVLVYVQPQCYGKGSIVFQVVNDLFSLQHTPSEASHPRVQQYSLLRPGKWRERERERALPTEGYAGAKLNSKL